MSEFIFADQNGFRQWLMANHQQTDSIWLVFGKKNGPQTLSPQEALEEALCFGWIDGQIQRIDEQTYRKRFSPRRKQSVWSKKNRETVSELIEQKRIMPAGLEAISRARKAGTWESELDVISEKQVSDFCHLVEVHDLAYTHLMCMSKSVQKTYTGYYLSAKGEDTKNRRLLKIVDRLNQNLKPM
ncbi:MAG: hypothetical protein IH571_04240 [Acholeplasmataceae bacterium]|nr:hypothetical protein [Acholeplasmataceae bacterium]